MAEREEDPDKPTTEVVVKGAPPTLMRAMSYTTIGAGIAIIIAAIKYLLCSCPAF